MEETNEKTPNENDLPANFSWDEGMLIKAYNKTVKVVGEDIAKQVALSTNGKVVGDSQAEEEAPAKVNYKQGDYVRATYKVDGCDYEAKIIDVNMKEETCVVKYIGYDNEETVCLKDLVPSWGKKARRAQFEKATKSTKRLYGSGDNKGDKQATKDHLNIFPPPPPIPPMLNQNLNNSEHLSAMLVSWYMSGYYTGIYEGMQIAKKKSEQ